MYDLIVIGGGPAGLAAACSAWEKGLKRSWSSSVTKSWAAS